MNELGSDVVRYFFVMRSMNSHLDFDLDMAKDQSDKNLCSIYSMHMQEFVI